MERELELMKKQFQNEYGVNHDAVTSDLAIEDDARNADKPAAPPPSKQVQTPTATRAARLATGEDEEHRMVRKVKWRRIQPARTVALSKTTYRAEKMIKKKRRTKTIKTKREKRIIQTKRKTWRMRKSKGFRAETLTGQLSRAVAPPAMIVIPESLIHG
ncbi:hypothetical protein BZA05DRAFT_449538 [Tricharina praecox]|uniref:uncharacterized protein n=1 Tax=Tricharina praecox TaxID=43433 RepID=UPI00221FE16D|nr:uncharacterized protein BZA05DRAFT_449538 [Tricharina praecox]KAI5841313.1 hypothetical protein BZA05DRAFT_449538 [Tricharina praecox]